MNKVLLPCKYEYVVGMMEGKKKYEYRNRLFSKPVDTIIVYATSPVSQVVGEIKVKEIIKDSAFNIWNSTNSYGYISFEDYASYMLKSKKEEVPKFIYSMLSDGNNKNISKENCKSSIEKAVYDYFNKEVMAVEIEKFITYDRPKDIKEFNLFKAPQSYVYI